MWNKSSSISMLKHGCGGVLTWGVNRLQDQADQVHPSSSKFIGDLVAVQRTQFGGGLKLRPKSFGPYQITEVKPRDRYTVEKVGDHTGPNVTATSVDLMKYFSHG
ncbi:uncharacterized protein TNCV_2790781 [Trichonephila clavipes]|nr:uncharacterized protein TNCV_2790781 [Trichonephila clavipes]